MKPLVYLIGTSTGPIEAVNDALYGYYRVKMVPKGQLMGAVYGLKPSVLIVLVDDLDRDSLRTVNALLLLSYIPTICITYKNNNSEVSGLIENATYMKGQIISDTLPLLMDQSCKFSGVYQSIEKSYNTYELMSEEVREALEIYINPTIADNDRGIVQYIHRVYESNMFLDNCPKVIWLLKSLGDEKFHGTRYDLKGQAITQKIEFSDVSLDINNFTETGFIKNTLSGELSDVDSIVDLIPRAIVDQHESIKNVACYGVLDLMVVAIDYKDRIEQVDLNILKNFAVKLDLMVNIKSKVTELEDAFVYTMNALARAAEGKDDVTGNHIKRVNLYAKYIAKVMLFSDQFVNNIAVAAQMHDIGKILIDEGILNKPARLTEDEFKKMQAHTTFGQKVVGESAHLQMASSIARYHHEKYDGTGYPDGVAGEAIPIEARIVAIGDIYDALRSERPYKKSFSHEACYKIIVKGDGRVEPKHFDPEVLKVFIDHHEAFDQIFQTYGD